MPVVAVFADQLDPLKITFDDPVYLGQVIEMDFTLDPITGTEWIFHLRDKAAGGSPLITKTTTLGTFPVVDIDNIAQLRLSATETAAWTAGTTYEFEVWLILVGDRPLMAATGTVKPRTPIAPPS